MCVYERESVCACVRVQIALYARESVSACECLCACLSCG